MSAGQAACTTTLLLWVLLFTQPLLMPAYRLQKLTVLEATCILVYAHLSGRQVRAMSAQQYSMHHAIQPREYAWLHIQVELHVTSIHCISRADILPFEVSDAARSEEEIKEAEAAGELRARVSQDVRLNGRYIDLRTAANQAIFKVQSGVCQVCEGIPSQHLHCYNLQCTCQKPKFGAGKIDLGQRQLELAGVVECSMLTERGSGVEKWHCSATSGIASA